MRAPAEFADITADVLARIRSRAPRVHCITNAVAQAYTANMLLAAGAIPSMTISPEEIAAFAAGADALLVNLGTFDAERRAAIELALGAKGRGRKATRPWVLDPVFIERSPVRAKFAQDLLKRGPAAVRLNQREFAAIAGGDAAGKTPARFAKTHKTIVALTGKIDVVTDGRSAATIANGHAMMSLVTAMGCTGSALLCAALAVEADAWRAAVAALVALGVAGEVAALSARGPGSFAGAIIDALHNLDRATLRARTRVSAGKGS
jgi:hydroxyethylthiazole kinase